MTSNGELVRNAFAAWEAGDNRAFFGIVAPDVTWRVIGTTAVSGTYHSKKEFLIGTAAISDAFAEPLVAKVVAVHEAGDTVVLQWQGTSRGRNGTPYDQSYCWVMKVADGKVTDVVAYLDTALLERLLA
jgi:ketosteroid isomerase-like protein